MQKKYEVIRLVRQNAGCHMIMDYVEGQLLTEYLASHAQLEKEELFSWGRQIIKQLEDLHSVKGVRAYRYVTPFCMIIKRNKELALLDLNAKSNQPLLKQVCGEKIRESFFPMEEAYNDIYSFGKTMQYLLAKTSPNPALTFWEERRFKKIITKCLSGNSKKQYQKFSEILLDFPQITKKENYKPIKKKRIFAVFAVVAAAGMSLSAFGEKTLGTDAKIERKEAEQQISFFDVGMTYFLDLEDYQKSAEMFRQEKQEQWLAEQYVVIADYMAGKSQKKEEEIEAVLQLLEEKMGTEEGGERTTQYKRSLLKVYMKLDTEETRQKCMTLGEELLADDSWKKSDVDKSIETEIRKIVAEVCEKRGEHEKAWEEYQILRQWNRKEEIYAAMFRVAGEHVENGELLELCRQGIKDNPDSKQLRMQYIRLQCSSKETSREACETVVREMISECPQLLEDSEFQKLMQECGIRVEGEQVWVEK